MIDVSINEISMDEKFVINSSKNENLSRFDDFLKLIIELSKEKIVSGLFVTDDFYSKYIAADYSVNDWLQDKTINRDHTRILRIKLQNAIFISKDKIDGECVLKAKGDEFVGLGATYALESFDKPIVISVVYDECWNQEEIKGNYRFIDDDSEISEEERILHNITRTGEIAKYKNEAICELYSTISSGIDLWDRRDELFPNLTFCDSVKKQLYDNPERYHIIRVIDRLRILQDYFSQKHDRYDPIELGYNARPESDSVQNTPELRDMRKFRLPSGEEKYFFDHISLSSPKYSAGRIHFFPDIEHNNCFIGYIGEHLKTAKY